MACSMAAGRGNSIPRYTEPWTFVWGYRRGKAVQLYIPRYGHLDTEK